MDVHPPSTELPGRQDGSIIISESVNTPRRAHLLTAGYQTIAHGMGAPPYRSPRLILTQLADRSHELQAETDAEPYSTLIKAFSSYGAVDREEFRPLVRYLERMSLPEGYVLWRQGDDPDGLYIIESGVLKAAYHFSEYARPTEESMVPGTVAGELSALSDSSRNATCTVERPAVVWKLSTASLKRMEMEDPVAARRFTKLVLKGGLCHQHTARCTDDLRVSLCSRKIGQRHSLVRPGGKTVKSQLPTIEAMTDSRHTRSSRDSAHGLGHNSTPRKDGGPLAM